MTGYSSTTDLEILFQLIHLQMTAPRIDELALERYLDDELAYASDPSIDPAYAEFVALLEARYDDRRYDRRAEQRACRAATWNPNVRYRPGHQVSRNGMVYVATGLSASVWNVNSPPEWTPNYWVPANCSTRNDGHARQGRRGDLR